MLGEVSRARKANAARSHRRNLTAEGRRCLQGGGEGENWEMEVKRHKVADERVLASTVRRGNTVNSAVLCT